MRLLRRTTEYGILLAMTRIALCASIIIVGLSGCGGRTQNNSAASGSPKEVKVAFWGGPDEVTIISKVINEWQKSHPGILVRLEHTPYRGYADKLLTRIAGRSSPDIICTEVDLFVTFQSKGVFLDLTPYVKADPEFNIKDYYPEIINRFTVDGKLYAIPRDTAPFACVYYNKKLFDEAAIAYPTDDWNIYDLLENSFCISRDNREYTVIAPLYFLGRSW